MFKDKYGPWALVIGGSEGIGLRVALKLAAQGLNIAITARKQAALDAAAANIRAAAKVDVRTLSVDMTAADMMERVAAFTKDVDVGMLVYGAGGMDRITGFFGDTIEGHLHTIKINCEAPTRLAHHFGGLMKKRGRGGLILMSSGAALAGAYGIPVYAATKSYDMILAEGLWYELKEFNVAVLGPIIGSVRTPSTERLLGTEDGADADETAQEILDNLENGPILFMKAVQGMLPFVRDVDRRKAVTAICEAAKAFFPPQTKRTPFDPKAVVR